MKEREELSRLLEKGPQFLTQEQKASLSELGGYMPQIKFNLGKMDSVQCLSDCCSTSDYSLVLCGIFVSKRGTAIATDGRMLVRVKGYFPPQKTDTMIPTRRAISRKYVLHSDDYPKTESINTVIRSGKQRGAIKCLLNQNQVLCLLNWGINKLPEKKRSEYYTLVRFKHQNKPEVYCQGVLIRKILRAFLSIEGEKVFTECELRTGKPEAPLYLKCGNSEGVVMPMRPTEIKGIFDFDCLNREQCEAIVHYAKSKIKPQFKTSYLQDKKSYLISFNQSVQPIFKESAKDEEKQFFGRNMGMLIDEHYLKALRDELNRLLDRGESR